MSLLGNPGMSIERITEEVGYRDIRSFRRVQALDGSEPGDLP